MKEFTKALDNSHSKWMRCSKKLKERYIKEFVYNEMGFPIYKKSSKGPLSSKKRKVRKMETINLNLTDNDTNPGVSINTSYLTHNPIETKNKNQNQSPKQEISDEMIEQVVIAKHNIDQEPNTPTKYGIKGIPTMLLFKGGELKATKVGATTKSNIVSWIKENFLALIHN